VPDQATNSRIGGGPRAIAVGRQVALASCLSGRRIPGEVRSSDARDDLGFGLFVSSRNPIRLIEVEFVKLSSLSFAPASIGGSRCPSRHPDRHVDSPNSRGRHPTGAGFCFFFLLEASERIAPSTGGVTCSVEARTQAVGATATTQRNTACLSNNDGED